MNETCDKCHKNHAVAKFMAIFKGFLCQPCWDEIKLQHERASHPAPNPC